MDECPGAGVLEIESRRPFSGFLALQVAAGTGDEVPQYEYTEVPGQKIELVALFRLFARKPATGKR
jgi:hypothetical protein